MKTETTKKELVKFRRKLNLSDMCFLDSFESKIDAIQFAEKIKDLKKYDSVRMQKAVCYNGKKTFYRVYAGYYSYYL
jgi:hypothetical protein